MICPYCNKEMKKGYISQQNLFIPLTWYSNEKKGVMYKKNETVKLTAALKGGEVFADYCPECKKIIIDTSTLNV